MSSGFCGVFWYRSNSVMNCEETKMCPILYGSEILAILGVIIGKINNMLLCVKFMLICACVSINMEVVINRNYM